MLSRFSRPSPADIRNLIFDWTSLYAPLRVDRRKERLPILLNSRRRYPYALSFTRSAVQGTPHWF
jgi:hypothetical protein